MTTTHNVRNIVATVCLVMAAVVVASLYVVGCVQQSRGKYRHERDTRDHVKGQVQVVPHELGK